MIALASKLQNQKIMTAYTSHQNNIADFVDARLGLFVHFGLYSLLGRGEWVMNREQIPVEDYKKLANRFNPTEFDADRLVQIAQKAGARYLCFTTMHHDGFSLYDSDVNPFNSMRLGPRRDLVREVVDACRRRNLRIHLYHSLNNWTAQPDGAAALENKNDYKRFVANTHERIRELLTLFNPIDCLWYDGWWPFNAEGWQSKQMNEMVRSIQPHILVNGRNGLPGDFATPEQHMRAPQPYRAWEACVTHGRTWGYHAGETYYKNTADIIDMVTRVASGAGNLLLNVGPDGHGRIPQPSSDMLTTLGAWLSHCGEAIFASELFTYNLRSKGDDRGDFHSNGRYTAKGNMLYVHLFNWPGESFSIGGAEERALSCRLLGTDIQIKLEQQGQRITFRNLPKSPPNELGGVLAVEFDSKPALYLTAGMRLPQVDHPRYDPCPSDILD